jgi:hypothetical protein
MSFIALKPSQKPPTPQRPHATGGSGGHGRTTVRRARPLAMQVRLAARPAIGLEFARAVKKTSFMRPSQPVQGIFMHPNQTRLGHFYAAFARLDADAMAACYAPDAQFEDEVFSLSGHEQVSGMWRMLCEAWTLSYSGLEADDRRGKAHWEADYRFSAARRKVHNVIDSVFEFNQAGLITRQRDRFNFWNWSRQALGLPGILLGWNPSFRTMVKRQAEVNLENYLQARKK